MTSLPFAHLNLRFNPFREATREERQGLAVVDIDDVADWISRPRRALQFLGDHGRGKSTHVIALHARFPSAPYVRGTREQPVSVPDAPLVFIDEIDNVLDRRSLWRRESTFVFTTHRDLAAEARGIELRTVKIGGIGADRLSRILERRIEWARRSAGPVPTLPRPILETLLARHGDDVRAIESELYDRIQAMEAPGDVQV